MAKPRPRRHHPCYWVGVGNTLRGRAEDRPGQCEAHLPTKGCLLTQEKYSTARSSVREEYLLGSEETFTITVSGRTTYHFQSHELECGASALDLLLQAR